MDVLQPPELTKYLTVSKWGASGEVRLPASQTYTFPPTHLFILIYISTHAHTHIQPKNSSKKVEPPGLPVRLALTYPI